MSLFESYQMKAIAKCAEMFGNYNYLFRLVEL